MRPVSDRETPWMSSRLDGRTTVSWILVTIAFVVACFIGALVAGEWLARRSHSEGEARRGAEGSGTETRAN